MSQIVSLAGPVPISDSEFSGAQDGVIVIAIFWFPLGQSVSSLRSPSI